MILGNNGQEVEIAVIDNELGTPRAGSSDRDVHLVTRVRLGDFMGAVDTWVVRGVWDEFLVALGNVEKDRHGVAALDALPMSEVRLQIAAIDKAGHIAISGELTNYYVAGSGTNRPQCASLRFGEIEIDPTLLPALLQELRRVTTP